MFALPPTAVPIVLNVDVPDRALSGGGRLRGGPLPRVAENPGYQAMMRQAISFAVKAVLIAAGRTPDPY